MTQVSGALIGRCHPDDKINAEVAADVLEGERCDLSVGAEASWWECECGTQHGRGHFQVIGVHRCLGCGYVGTGGRMFHPEDEQPGPWGAFR